MKIDRNKHQKCSEKKKTQNLQKLTPQKRLDNGVIEKACILVGSKSKTKKKGKSYSAQDIKNALQAVQSGLSLNKASKVYGIPVATLYRKNKNPDNFTEKPGPPPVLSYADEQEIEKWILYRSERGYPVTKSELIDSTQAYLDGLKRVTIFKNNRPSRHWYEGFRKRYPNLSIRKPQQLSLRRAMVTQEDLQEWFTEQTNYLTKKNLLNISPDRVFNYDESSVLLCPESEKVLTAKGARNVYSITDASKESITVLFMYSASGTRAPPMIMLKYIKNLPKKIIENTPNSWGLGMSESGWMTTETFYEYVTNILVTSSNSTHIEESTIKTLETENETRCNNTNHEDLSTNVEKKKSPKTEDNEENTSSILQDATLNTHVNLPDQETITQKRSFATAFTLPVEYLPKKKRTQLEKKNLPKLPAAGTSDEWWKAQMEKEKENRDKEKKAAERKKLLEEKKKYEEEKRKIVDKLRALNPRIKKEK